MQYANQATATTSPTPALLNALDETDQCVKELFNALDQLAGNIEAVSKPTPPLPGAPAGNLKEVSGGVSPITDRIHGISKSLREITMRMHYARERLEI